MTLKFTQAILLPALLLFVVSAAASPGISGNWQASVMGAQIKASVQQRGTVISGVAHIYNGGKKDTYHFNGTFDGQRLIADHHDGHRFSGNLTPDGRIEGVIKTRKGHSVRVNASRY